MLVCNLEIILKHVYGVLKSTFLILKQIILYLFRIQINIVIACYEAQNFTKIYNIDKQLFMDYINYTIFIAKEQVTRKVQEQGWNMMIQNNKYKTNLHNYNVIQSGIKCFKELYNLSIVSYLPFFCSVRVCLMRRLDETGRDKKN